MLTSFSKSAMFSSASLQAIGAGHVPKNCLVSHKKADILPGNTLEGAAEDLIDLSVQKQHRCYYTFFFK